MTRQTFMCRDKLVHYVGILSLDEHVVLLCACNTARFAINDRIPPHEAAQDITCLACAVQTRESREVR